LQTKEKKGTEAAARPPKNGRRGGSLRIADSVTIRRPVVDVFALAGDYENDPLWRSGVVEMRYETPDDPRVGARTREVMRILGGRATTVAEIVEFERDRRTAFESRSGPVPVRGSRTFEPVVGGTRFAYELSMRPKGPWALLSPVLATVLRRRAARDLRELKRMLEGGDGDHRTRSVGSMRDSVRIVR